MTEREAIAYIEQWDVTEAAKVLKWYEDNELLRPCDCDTMIAIETESLRAENAKLRVERDEWRRVAVSKQDIIDHMRDANAENAKLRELVGDIWEFGFSNSAGANSVKEWYRVRDELEQRVYAALGVDDG